MSEDAHGSHEKKAGSKKNSLLDGYEQHPLTSLGEDIFGPFAEMGKFFTFESVIDLTKEASKPVEDLLLKPMVKAVEEAPSIVGMDSGGGGKKDDHGHH